MPINKDMTLCLSIWDWNFCRWKKANSSVIYREKNKVGGEWQLKIQLSYFTNELTYPALNCLKKTLKNCAKKKMGKAQKFVLDVAIFAELNA